MRHLIVVVVGLRSVAIFAKTQTNNNNDKKMQGPNILHSDMQKRLFELCLCPEAAAATREWRHRHLVEIVNGATFKHSIMVLCEALTHQQQGNTKRTFDWPTTSACMTLVSVVLALGLSTELRTPDVTQHILDLSNGAVQCIVTEQDALGSSIFLAGKVNKSIQVCAKLKFLAHFVRLRALELAFYAHGNAKDLSALVDAIVHCMAFVCLFDERDGAHSSTTTTSDIKDDDDDEDYHDDDGGRRKRMGREAEGGAKWTDYAETPVLFGSPLLITTVVNDCIHRVVLAASTLHHLRRCDLLTIRSMASRMLHSGLVTKSQWFAWLSMMSEAYDVSVKRFVFDSLSPKMVIEQLAKICNSSIAVFLSSHHGQKEEEAEEGGEKAAVAGREARRRNISNRRPRQRLGYVFPVLTATKAAALIHFCRFVDSSTKASRAENHESVRKLYVRHPSAPLLLLQDGAEGIALSRLVHLMQRRPAMLFRHPFQRIRVDDSYTFRTTLRLLSEARRTVPAHSILWRYIEMHIDVLLFCDLFAPFRGLEPAYVLSMTRDQTAALYTKYAQGLDEAGIPHCCSTQLAVQQPSSSIFDYVALTTTSLCDDNHYHQVDFFSAMEQITAADAPTATTPPPPPLVEAVTCPSFHDMLADLCTRFHDNLEHVLSEPANLHHSLFFDEGYLYMALAHIFAFSFGTAIGRPHPVGLFALPRKKTNEDDDNSKNRKRRKRMEMIVVDMSSDVISRHKKRKWKSIVLPAEEEEEENKRRQQGADASSVLVVTSSSWTALEDAEEEEEEERAHQEAQASLLHDPVVGAFCDTLMPRLGLFHTFTFTSCHRLNLSLHNTQDPFGMGRMMPFQVQCERVQNEAALDDKVRAMVLFCAAY